MNNISRVAILFQDGKQVTFEKNISLCDEVYKGVKTADGHMSSCVSEEEALRQLKKYIQEMEKPAHE